jgi:cell division control protein 6
MTGAISEIYDELCAELGVTPLTQRRLSTLVNELDAMGLVNAKVVSMGRYGRTKKIRLEIQRSIIKDVFAGDNRLGRLIDYSQKCFPKHDN